MRFPGHFKFNIMQHSDYHMFGSNRLISDRSQLHGMFADRCCISRYISLKRAPVDICHMKTSLSNLTASILATSIILNNFLFTSLKGLDKCFRAQRNLLDVNHYLCKADSLALGAGQIQHLFYPWNFCSLSSPAHSGCPLVPTIHSLKAAQWRLLVQLTRDYRRSLCRHNKTFSKIAKWISRLSQLHSITSKLFNSFAGQGQGSSFYVNSLNPGHIYFRSPYGSEWWSTINKETFLSFVILGLHL